MRDTGAIRVLHVDDQPAFTDLVAEMLAREDDRIEVVGAERAAEGLSLLESEPVDCVLSDYQMPGRDGIEFLRAVRESYPDLPFILLTGKGSEAVASDAVSAGATDYIRKASGSEQYELLANRIHNAVENVERKAELRRYGDLLNTIQEGACIYDPEGRYEVVNEFLAEWYDTTPEELVGEPSALVERVRETHEGDPFAELLAGEREQLRGEIEGEFPGHGFARLHYRLVPFRSQGEITGVVATALDLTELYHRERELDARLTAMEAAIDGIAILDREETHAYVNRAYAETYGYDDPEALVGEPWTACYPEEECRRLESTVVPRLREAGEWRGEATGRRADGETFPQEVSLTLTDDDRTVCVVRDVTERAAYERKLTALHEVARELSAVDSVEAACERTIEASREILDLDLSLINVERDGVLVPVAVSEEVRPDGLDTMALNEGVAGLTYRNGESVRIDDLTEHPQAKPQGSYESAISVPVGDHGVFQAVATEPGWFDEQDLELAELLLSHTTTALDRLEHTRRLEEKNEQLEQFASVVSHDLRSPLNVAQGRIELARREGDLEHLADAEAGIERALELIEDLLVLAREGTHTTDVEPVDLAELTEACRRELDIEDVRVEVDDDRLIRADPGRLRQLLENLLKNAVEHGGADVTVTVGDRPGGFYVADDGPGLPADLGERVFDPGVSGGESGTGIGLSIVAEIAEAHGWTVSAGESDAGGARFDVEGVEDVDE